MLTRIKEMWNRAFDPESRATTVHNTYYPIVDRPNRAEHMVIANGVVYEWWVTANTPWEWPEFFSLGASPHFDIYRQVNYKEEIIEGEIEEITLPSEGLFEEIFKDGSPMVEVFADEVHKIWCGQIDWIFAQSGHMGPRGQFTINPEVVGRWERQKITPYKDLPEDEKATDRAIAKRYLRLALDG